MQEPDEAAIAELKAVHSELRLLSTHVDEESFFIVARPMKRPEWMRIQEAESQQRPRLIEQTFRDCAQWPAKLEIDQILDKKPALAVTFFNQLAKLGGLTAEVAVKKL